MVDKLAKRTEEATAKARSDEQPSGGSSCWGGTKGMDSVFSSCQVFGIPGAILPLTNALCGTRMG